MSFRILKGLALAGLLLAAPMGRAIAQDVVDVEIEPSALSVPQGDCFSFTVNFIVPHHDPQTFMASASVRLPSGGTIPLGRPRELTVGAHATLTLGPTLCVPRRAPQGQYVLTVEARQGGTLLDSDTLTVTIVPGMGTVESWELRDL